MTKNLYVPLLISVLLTFACSVSNATIQARAEVPAKPVLVVPTVQPMTVTAESLRLRTQPDGYGGDTIAILPSGSEVVPMLCQSFDGMIWVYVRYGELEGWVSKEWLIGEC